MSDIIKTNQWFWDCECKENYIHHISERICKVCKVEAEEQPNSRQNEIEELFPEEFEGKEIVPVNARIHATGVILTIDKNQNIVFKGLECIDEEMYYDGRLVEWSDYHNAFVIDK